MKKVSLLLLGRCLFIMSFFLASDDEAFLSFENEKPYPVSWYQKSLETSMQIWGDLDMLCRGQDDMLPDHSQLVIDTTVGRLVYLDWCLKRMAEESRGPIEAEHISYLVRIVFALDDVYQEALEKDGTGRIESARPVLNSVRQRMSKVLKVPYLLDTNHAFSAPGKQETRRTNLFDPVKVFWYCGCRII